MAEVGTVGTSTSNRTLWVLAALGGVASRADLVRAGIDDAAIRAAVVHGEVVRLRRDAFVAGELWRSATSWERHAPRARAVVRGLDPDGDGRYALSHHSALAAHGIGLHGVDDRVHVVGTRGQPGRRAGMLVVHTAVSPSIIRRDSHGYATVPVAIACVQVATRDGAEAALVSADDALRRRLTTPGGLRLAAAAYTGVRGSRAVRELAEHATALHESGGETRTSWLLRAIGAEHERQVALTDARGFVGRVDFLIRSRATVIEFDGLGKYDVPGALAAEKLREDRLRELGFEVVRLTWADLHDPGLVRGKLFAAFDRADRRR